MSLFTTNEANACTIISMMKRVKGSSVIWTVVVEDSDKNNYDMDIKGLSEDSSKSDIKSAISAILLETMKRPAQTIPVITEVTDKGAGETIG